MTVQSKSVLQLNILNINYNAGGKRKWFSKCAKNLYSYIDIDNNNINGYESDDYEDILSDII